jgi:hypothetical protein
MSTTTYRYPDGPKLDYTYGELTAADADSNTVALPIDPTGLSELADKLANFVTDTDTGDLAEQAGAGAAIDCMNALLAAKGSTQGERIQIIQDAIMNLSTTGNPKRAAGGFGCVVEHVFMFGLEIL